jgi:hypothetical protein
VDPILAEDDTDYQLRPLEFIHWPIRNFHKLRNGVTNSDGKSNAFISYTFGMISVLNNVKSMRIEFWLLTVAQRTSQRWA